jgi:glycosyltransferase involved in cell wall biosynthesis
MEPLVSVVIPVYNAEKYIADTLRSVLAQSVTNIDVIVVDDGSTDNSRTIIEKFTHDARIRYIQQRNQGVSAARNTGYRNAEGKFIAFLDSDDIWFENNLELKLQKFKSGDYGLVHSDCELIDGHSMRNNNFLKGKEGMILNDLLSWNGTQIPGPSSVLIKREVLDNVGLFDSKISTSADFDLFIRIAAKFNVGRVSEVTWQYRIHDNNMHGNITTMEHDVLYVFNKVAQMNLFESEAFKRKCIATTYLILGASWTGKGKNIARGIFFMIRSILTDPSVFMGRLLGRLRKSKKIIV